MRERASAAAAPRQPLSDVSFIA